MVSLDRFRAIALAMPDATESAHMGHPDFRVGGKIFASLQPGRRLGVVKLTPEQQARFLDEHPGACEAQAGAWGRQGWTGLRLDVADEETVGEAVTLARQNLQLPSRKSGRPTARRR
jgi:hypothetical protein